VCGVIAARLRQHLTALDLVALRTAQQHTHVVARTTFVQQLAEHLNARAGRLRRVLDADDLDLVAHLDDAALNTTRHHRAATGNREHVLDRHQERLVNRTLRLRNVRVQRLDQLSTAVVPSSFSSPSSAFSACR
jgi:hypothetical protein